MKIAVASDHGGFALKEEIAKYLTEAGYDVLNLGTNSAESVDYPEYGKKCAEAVVSGQAERGIVVCGTGIGISMAANKVKGVRCALCTYGGNDAPPQRCQYACARRQNDWE